MKTRKLLSFLTLAGVTFLFSSCSETINNVEDTLATVADEKSAETLLIPGDSCTYSGVLTEAEIEGLMEMREEEKLAHDVYLSFFETFEYVVFNNIAKSEQAHTNAVLRLIEGYGLEDPALPETGVFDNAIFNDLYVSLISEGSENLLEALKIGAFIEEYDIADLQRLLAETENEDIYRVYSNLLRGSKNHLRAFTNSISRLGETYSPTILSEADYQEILDSSGFSN